MKGWLVFDIETRDAPEASILEAINAHKVPRNIKDPAKIAASTKEAAERIAAKAALLDDSPLCCAVIVADGEGVVFDGMGAQSGVDGMFAFQAATERGMLELLREWLNCETSLDTVIAGHNIKGFDLPKLRHAYVRNRLALPNILQPRILNEETAFIIDTVNLIKAYSMELRDEFCPSLDNVCRVLGIQRPKSVISGADVPRLYNEGRYTEILTYCAIDTLATTQAFLLMTGQSPELR